MAKFDYPDAISALILQLKRLPGIGPRGAERIALWMLRHREARCEEIAAAIHGVAGTIQPCKRCGFFSTGEFCPICLDPSRSVGPICVVEQATDILPIERTSSFRGTYHALNGRLSPLDHIGPENLRIGELISRAREEHPPEIILALSADVEGEATANYLGGLLRDLQIPLTRIAQGIPVGGGLENAGELTLLRAFSGRTRVDLPSRPEFSSDEIL